MKKSGIFFKIRDILYVLFTMATSFLLGIFLSILNYHIIINVIIYAIYTYLITKLHDSSFQEPLVKTGQEGKFIGVLSCGPFLLGCLVGGIQYYDFYIPIFGILLCGAWYIFNYFRKQKSKL